GRHFFPDTGKGDPRLCPTCQNGRLSLKLGRFGAFVGCSNYPECRYTRRLAIESGENAGAEAEASAPRILGTDPETGLTVSLRRGPYGAYAQLGESNGPDGEKPKRASLPKGLAPADVDLARALALLSLPRTIGAHPEDSQPITAGLGRFGPYIKHGKTFKSIPADDDVLTIGLNRAVALLAESNRKRGGPPGKEIGNHPEDGKPITLHEGRYGPYLRHGRTIASVPKSVPADGLTVGEAVPILAARADKSRAGKTGGARGTRAKKADGEQPAAREKEKKPARRAKRRAGGGSRGGRRSTDSLT